MRSFPYSSYKHNDVGSKMEIIIYISQWLFVEKLKDLRNFKASELYL